MEERNAHVRRLFVQAAQKIGSRARLAEALGISYEEVGRYMAGAALPPEDVLARTAAVLGEELRRIRSSSAPEVWAALKLPR